MVATGVQRFKLFINGRWEDAASGRTFESVNPAKGAVWAVVPEGDAADIDRAARAARQAFDKGPWRTMAPAERGHIIRKLGDLVKESIQYLAEIETQDNGKAIRETGGVEMPAIANWYYYFAGLADKTQGETIPINENILNYTLREPVGVVGAIVPWNSPLLMMAFKLAPALAAGNTVVLKPAEQTPVTALEFCKLVEKAGFPPGVVNVVTGFGETAGAALVRHPEVNKIAFTGETVTGQIIAREAAATLKHVSFELGGKSPQIVFADADMENALVGAASGVFVAAGQTCVAGSRLFVERAAYDEFLTKLSDRARRIRVGDPLRRETQMGSQTSLEQLRKIESYVEIGRKEGARLLAGGARPQDPDLSSGYFFTPTVFADVDNKMRIAQEEIFGPVVVAAPFEDEDELIARANDVKYGLAAGVWTRDIKRAHRVARKLQAGTVWVNCYRRIHWASPFGGYKMSGYGRENGLEVMRLYTQVKSVWVDLAEQLPDPYAT
jgi:acyl-CoA reductase-like NAD-dependent aldehyde dehydrogenase